MISRGLMLLSLCSDYLRIVAAINQNIISTKISRMSFLKSVTMDPHIHLLAFNESDSLSQRQLLEKIHFLAQTRRFDGLLEESKKLPDMKFATLEQRLKSASEKTKADKQQLSIDNINEVLAVLQEDAANDDGSDEKIDRRQEDVYRLSKILYDEGNYEQAYDIMKSLQSQDLGDSLYLRTTWAKLYCEIMLKSVKAKKTAERLKKKIDESSENDKKQKKKTQKSEIIDNTQVQKQFARKAEFLNLLCFALFMQPKQQDYQKFVDICASGDYFAVVQLACPHILRYLCICLIMNKTLHKNRSFDMYMMTQVIRRKMIKTRDPFVDFFSTLAIDFDFEAALSKIELLRQEIGQDFLLAPLQTQLIENCYFLYYKIYCKVYDRVSISEIAQSISKSQEEAELWILRYIRSLDIDAKIDSVEGIILSVGQKELISEKYFDLIPKVKSLVSALSQMSNE